MDVVCWNIFQLWYPSSNIFTLWIELLGLCQRVEDQDTASTDSWTSCPASKIRGAVMVDQFLLEVVGTFSPILLQIHGQVACYHHPSSIRHEPCIVHLPHESIHKRHASITIPPSLNLLWICLPRIVSSVVDAILTEDFVAMVETPIPLEVSPEKFIHIHSCWLISLLLLLELLSLPVDFSDGEWAICKPWRKLWRVIWTE